MSDASGDSRWKQTLNLPRTDFPMKGNLTQLEPRILARWEAEDTYRALLRKNAAAPRFVFLDGPPYANGELHAGHALNHVLKDIVVKSRSMAGLLCAFRPGWDCHGLPIEQAVEKRLRERKVDRRALSRDQFLAACREYALEYIGLQAAVRRRMGNFALWDEAYRTLDFPYEAQELRELARIARRGLHLPAEEGRVLVHHRPDGAGRGGGRVRGPPEPLGLRGLSHRAGDRGSASGAPPRDARGCLSGPRGPGGRSGRLDHHPLDAPRQPGGRRPPDARVRVLRPRPPGHRGGQGPPAAGPRRDRPGPARGEDRAAAGGEVSAASLVEPRRILGYATGRDLEGFAYRHPSSTARGWWCSGEHVTLEQGTGLVHTAPGHGQEDYDVGIQYGLDIYNPVLADGRYDETVQPPELRGVKVFDANPRIVQLLVERGVLLNRPTDTRRAQLPALLALPQPDHLPRDATSGSSPWTVPWTRRPAWTPRSGARR